MKQILIAKNSQIKKLYGSELELSFDQDTLLMKGAISVAYFNLNMSLISGKGTFSIQFKPSEEIAQRGVALVSAFESNGDVTAYFVALTDNVNVSKGTSILVATLFEPIVYRQVDTAIASAVVQVAPEQSGSAVEMTTPEPTPKKRGGRRKKT